MSTCRWCTPVVLDATDLLQEYCSGLLTAEEKQMVNEDLYFCLDCVVAYHGAKDCVIAYHRAKDELPSLLQRLWELEATRLRSRFTEALDLEEDDLYIVEDQQETYVPKFTGTEFENFLRVPMAEMLRYPYLLAHRDMSEMFVTALCKMERSNPFHVMEKFKGIYILLVNPDEKVRRWAICAAKSLGKVDRDDYYELQDAFCAMFRLLDPDVFENCDIDGSFVPKNSKNIVLAPHLYDRKSYKNYWLGICMLLTQLDSQAMDSLLLGPDKQTDIIQCILQTMERTVDDEDDNPFWPSLQCFMVILDRLGSKVWGQLNEPNVAFQTITGSSSYTAEINKIRKSITANIKVKVESDGDDLVTCSQLIYDCNVKEKNKASSGMKSISADRGSVVYEEMHSLINVLQQDMGQDMRLHESTFLWFFPFLQSVMELRDLSTPVYTVYIRDVVRYLCDEVKDLVRGHAQTCDRVTEFFIFILVHIIESHLSRNCMNVLFCTASHWVEVIVKCATLPSVDVCQGQDSGSYRVTSTTSSSWSRNPSVSTVVHHTCLRLIRSLLREGGKMSSHAKAMQFLDLLNKQIRENPHREWNLVDLEIKELQNCLKQLVKIMKDKSSTSKPDPTYSGAYKMQPVASKKATSTEDWKIPVKREPEWDNGQCSAKDLYPCDYGTNVKEVKDLVAVAEYNSMEPSVQVKRPLKSTKISDPGKLKLIKSKLGQSFCHKLQDITKKHDAVNKDIPEELQSDFDRRSVECPLNFSGGQENMKAPESVTSNTGIGEEGAEYKSGLLKLEYGDDLPLSIVKSHLKKAQKLKHCLSSSETGLDRCQQSFLEDGESKSSGVEQAKSLKKEEQEATKIHVNADDYDYDQSVTKIEPTPSVIVISDSESEEHDHVSVVRNKDDETTPAMLSKFKMKSEPLHSGGSVKSSDVYKGALTECDSQLFEFETQELMFSEWNDCEAGSSEPMPEPKTALTTVKPQLSSDVVDSSSSWDYDTDPVSDENIENAVLQVEEHLKQQTVTKQPIDKTSVFLSPKGLPDKSKGSALKKRSRLEHSAKEKGIKALTADSSSSVVGTPAIVPPKKVRKPIECTSTAQRLGLKKKERVAVDLSQRSLDCVGRLRRYGQGVQVEQKQKIQKRSKKAKVISPQKLNVRNRNRKLLASQDLQFFRQSRQSVQGTSTNENCSSSKSNQAMNLNKTDSFDSFQHPDPVTDRNDLKMSVQSPQESPWRLRPLQTNFPEGKPMCSTTVLSDDPSTEKLDLFKRIEKPDLVVPTSTTDKYSGEGMVSENDLTQRDPVDMEMCSQEEEEEEDIFLTQRDPVDMDIETARQEHKEHTLCNNQLGASPVEPGTSEISTRKDECVFLKPGMSPSSLRMAKPSTTKIYAPSSRSATLVQEMEKTKPPPTVAKSKSVRLLLPQRKTSVPLSVIQESVPLKSPLLNSAVRSLPQVPTYKTYARPEAPVVKVVQHSEAGRTFDQGVLIQSILKWTYDMFVNYGQFGIPSDLCHFPLKEVPNSFKSYDDYFGTFYPLLLVNTFEELVNEWQKNCNSTSVKQHLEVTGIEYNSRIASACFTASLSDHEMRHQRYPKDDDLVMLWLPQNRSAYTFDEPLQDDICAHFGYVSRSNIITGGERTTLSLTVQTFGNVSSVNRQSVRCEVVGSLVSTIREFRALCFLRNSRMVWPFLVPHISYFQPDQGNLPSVSLAQYNSAQVSAIRSGISIVKRSEKSPKICLIHGPPGTGKSKTIVGLLQKLFSEGVENLSSKTRRLRVLLCAPSNAAIDNLMKKVIEAFKDNCRERKNPQGNCGDINLVRVGNERTIRKSLQLFSLDSQTKKRTQKAELSHESDIRRKEQLEHHIDNLSQRIAMAEKSTDKFKQLTAQKFQLLREREQLSHQLKETRSRKQETQARVLQDAHIICCTLSTSGSVVLESAFRRLGHEPFSCVIVDEAGQATETQTLIPMLFRCPALILVGDPEQLPPTVVSQVAREKKYDQSLMARLWRCLSQIVTEKQLARNPAIFLSLQYRMHPDICEFPSNYIYNKMLKTDCATAEERCAPSWLFQPYRLFDVTDGSETRENESFCNLKEVKLVLILIKQILQEPLVKVGVITPYSAQKYRIQESLSRDNLQVEVDTVDGFQGREMDCVIVSCVRANGELGSIGFLGNRQRLNVTITRAKCSLFVLGHLRTLREQKDWGALIDNAGKRGTIIRTSEKDFKRDVMQIFKPAKGSPHGPRRDGSSSSGPPGERRPSASSDGGRIGSASAEQTPAQISSHRATYPPSVAGVRSQDRFSTNVQRPRDPRLTRLCSEPAGSPSRPSRGEPVPTPQSRREHPRCSSSPGKRDKACLSHHETRELGHREPHHRHEDRRPLSHSSRSSSSSSWDPRSHSSKRPSDTRWQGAPEAKRDKN